MKFVINKNTHNSGLKLRWMPKRKSLNYSVMFDSIGMYVWKNYYRNNKSKQLKLKEQINKVYGIGYIFHQHNSFRFGYVPDGMLIHIYAYAYVKKKRISKYIISIPYDTYYNFNLSISKKNYIWRIGNVGGKMPHHLNRFQRFFSYHLYPYFGGKIPAPKKQIIHLIPN